LNQLGLIWGVDVFFYNKFVSTDESIDDIIEILKREREVHSGDIIVSTASMPITGRGRTNMVKISKIK
jgi:pyruvate kinase